MWMYAPMRPSGTGSAASAVNTHSSRSPAAAAAGFTLLSALLSSALSALVASTLLEADATAPSFVSSLTSPAAAFEPVLELLAAAAGATTAHGPENSRRASAEHELSATHARSRGSARSRSVAEDTGGSGGAAEAAGRGKGGAVHRAVAGATADAAAAAAEDEEAAALAGSASVS